MLFPGQVPALTYAGHHFSMIQGQTFCNNVKEHFKIMHQIYYNKLLIHTKTKKLFIIRQVLADI